MNTLLKLFFVLFTSLFMFSCASDDAANGGIVPIGLNAGDDNDDATNAGDEEEDPNIYISLVDTTGYCTANNDLLFIVTTLKGEFSSETAGQQNNTYFAKFNTDDLNTIEDPNAVSISFKNTVTDETIGWAAINEEAIESKRIIINYNSCVANYSE
ncbi:hypothetical protein MY04_0786 [Flammeovirga sp. MY04]|uniref:hypothetical protein n=1 Tax=Flammeovirga sp. MY04 TaxID=1191459 RepID=UPI000806100C|nr:hypothetical protein [Flammeovirga sp. MY04]ANQ48168.1 hypothetical protein MY04_0786 [Flammeovirga sp. MY04]